MINVVPSAVDAFAESATRITEGISTNVPIIGNAALCVDSVCAASRVGINFYCSPNLLSKVCFGASFVCSFCSAAASGSALVILFVGIFAIRYVGSLGARGFNCIGKYTLRMGNVTNGNITNISAIYDLPYTETEKENTNISKNEKKIDDFRASVESIIYDFDPE